jgi:hypothetical protein
MNRKELRDLIYEEISGILQDDALFKGRDHPGVLDTHEIPGDVDTGRNLSYGPTKATDSEGRMTKKHLYHISRKAQSLHDILDDDDDLPEWVQSKIARAAEKIQTVYDYLDHKIKTGNY